MDAVTLCMLISLEREQALDRSERCVSMLRAFLAVDHNVESTFLASGSVERGSFDRLYCGFVCEAP